MEGRFTAPEEVATLVAVLASPRTANERMTSTLTIAGLDGSPATIRSVEKAAAA
jgi:hypothetical protein